MSLDKQGNVGNLSNESDVWEEKKPPNSFMYVRRRGSRNAEAACTNISEAIQDTAKLFPAFINTTPACRFAMNSRAFVMARFKVPRR